MKIKCVCETCGKVFERIPSGVRQHTFCSRECSKKFTSKRMTEYNKTENPMNTSSGWTPEKRERVMNRERAQKGECKLSTYKKFHGKHEHRVVASEMLGRDLLPGETVHHINGDKHDNRPENLMVFKNQSEHMKYHAQHQCKNIPTEREKGVIK